MKKLKRFLPYLLLYKSKILIGFLFVALANICAAIVPKIVGTTIDLITSGDYGEDEIWNRIALILVLTAASGVFMFLTRRTIIVASRLIEYDLRKDLFDSIESQPMSFFHENSTGSMMALATNDIPASRDFLGPAIMYSANTITAFTMIMFFMLSIDPLLTLYSLLPLPLIAIGTFIIGKKVHVAYRDVQDQFSGLTTLAQETFSGIRIIKSYVRQSYELTQFAAKSEEYTNKNLRLAKIQAVAMPVFMILFSLSQLIVLGYGGYRVLEGTATLGELTQFFIYLNLLIWPVAAIGWIVNLVQRASASAGRLGDMIDKMEAVPDEFNVDNDTIYRGANSDDSINGSVDFVNVSCGYKTGYFGLKELNFSIPAGSSLGIVGSVGSGKTSLINALLNFYPIESGSILLGGKSVIDMPKGVLRRAISLVPQEPFLFSTSISENIKFGKPNADMDEIIEVAGLAQLHNEIEQFPKKYEAELGERGITLSGGQKQRVALARALIRNPQVIVLDDALSAVDTNTEAIILKNIKGYLRNRTSIIISHRLSTVQNCDKIIVLDGGRIIESGTHEELLLLCGKYAEIFKLQLIEKEIEELR